MKREVIEWVEKAEGDFISAKREYRARKRPNYDAACFSRPAICREVSQGVFAGYKHTHIRVGGP